jgi:uncharacterized protein (TIGR03437 family)
MFQPVGFVRTSLTLLVLRCPIACGVLPLIAAGASTPVTLQISTETAPPGGWAQFKISATAPILIASGQVLMTFDPTVFGPVAQVTAFSATGDQIGYASVNSQTLSASFSSASAGFGQLPELPVLVVTVPVLASATPGATSAITADPGAAWIGPQGNQYSISVTPSTFTVGGSLSIQAVTPGGGLLPSGTVVQITGTGFDSTTSVAIDGVSISQVAFISPSQVNLTLGGETELTGKHFHANATGAEIDYYSALPSAPADPGQGFTTLPGVLPILPMTLYTGSQMSNPLVYLAGTWGFAMLNSNLTPAMITSEGFFPSSVGQSLQLLFVDTVTIPAGELYLLDATSMLNALNFEGELWITSSAPIRFIDIRNAVDAGISPFLPSPITSPAPPVQVTLPASPTSVSWSWQVGTPAPAPSTVTLSGSLALTTSVSTTGGQWLSVSAVQNGSSSTLTLTPNPSSLAAGTYSGTVTVTPTAPPSLAGAAVVPTTINVALTATSAPQISFSPQNCCGFYEFVPNQPGGPPETGTVVSNGNPAQVTVSASTSNGGNWLTVSPLNGTTPLQLTVTANPAGFNLPPGSYSGQITIQGPANTITVPVGMTAVAPPTPSPPGTTLMIEGPAPAITLPAGAPASMSAFSFLGFQEFDVALTSVTTNVSWLTASIESPGPAPPAGISLYANAVGLSPGVYTGAITINSSNYPTLQVPATLTVIAVPTAQTVLTATPPSLSFTAPSGGTSASQNLAIGFNTGPVQFNIQGGAQWLQFSTPPGLNAAQPVYAYYASAAGLPPGTYYAGLVINWTTGSTTVPVTFSVTASTAFPPIVTALVDAASEAPGSIAPGEIITILGTGVGPAPSGLQLDASGKVATELGQTQVLIGGIAAPLIYGSASQVNTIVPYEIASSGITTVQVVYGGVPSATWEVPLAPSASSIFTGNSTGVGQAAVLNQDNTINGPANPAPLGTVIQIYATGGGQTGGITGALALPGEKISLPVMVMIGGVYATVQYAGSSPGEVEGLVQINAVVPSIIAAGGSVPIEVDIGNTGSQAGVTVAVK